MQIDTVHTLTQAAAAAAATALGKTAGAKGVQRSAAADGELPGVWEGG